MARMTKSASIGGRTISGSITRTEATEVGTRITVAAGKAGTLTTRTDDNTGTATLGSGHGITTGAIVDVYWSGGIRRGMTVGTVAGTSVPLDGGAGDNLPIATTALVVCVQTIVDLDLVAANIVMAAVAAQRRASIQFQEEAGTAILSLDLGISGTDGEIWDWASDMGSATPFGADVGKIALSNGSSAGTNIVTFGMAVDNDA